MAWQGYMTKGLKNLINCIYVLEKHYNIKLYWNEKIGNLRIRIISGNDVLDSRDKDNLSTLISAIESVSMNTCQVCGSTEHVHMHMMRAARHIMTLCDNCVRERIQVTNCKYQEAVCRTPFYVTDALKYLCNQFVKEANRLVSLLDLNNSNKIFTYCKFKNVD